MELCDNCINTKNKEEKKEIDENANNGDEKGIDENKRVNKICITENEAYKYTNIETKECFKTRPECERKSAHEKFKYFDN